MDRFPRLLLLGLQRLLLLSELLSLVLLLLDDGLARLYLFNFSLILDLFCCFRRLHFASFSLIV